MNDNNSFTHLLLKSFFMMLSLTCALVIIETPIWAISIVAAVLIFGLFIPYLNVIVLYFYHIVARPTLYVLATIVAIQEKQDVITIAFYVVAGIQAIFIIKNFVSYFIHLLVFVKHLFQRDTDGIDKEVRLSKNTTKRKKIAIIVSYVILGITIAALSFTSFDLYQKLSKERNHVSALKCSLSSANEEAQQLKEDAKKWKEKYDSTIPGINEESFVSVTKALSAIKRNPNGYNGKRISISSATLGKLNYDHILLFNSFYNADDIPNNYLYFEFGDSNIPKSDYIDVNLSSFVIKSSFDNGDLVSASGIVSITEDNICLEDLQLNLVLPYYER